MAQTCNIKDLPPPHTCFIPVFGLSGGIPGTQKNILLSAMQELYFCSLFCHKEHQPVSFAFLGVFLLFLLLPPGWWQATGGRPGRRTNKGQTLSIFIHTTIYFILLNMTKQMARSFILFIFSQDSDLFLFLFRSDFLFFFLVLGRGEGSSWEEGLQTEWRVGSASGQSHFLKGSRKAVPVLAQYFWLFHLFYDYIDLYTQIFIVFTKLIEVRYMTLWTLMMMTVMTKENPHIIGW